jgi:hypothetical protein
VMSKISISHIFPLILYTVIDSSLNDLQRSVKTLYFPPPLGQGSPPSRRRVGVEFWAKELFQHVEFLSF